MSAQDIAPELTEDGWRKLTELLNEPPRANPKLAAAFKKRRSFSARCLLATGLNIWFVLNLLGSLVVLRWVAEIDDGQRAK